MCSRPEAQDGVVDGRRRTKRPVEIGGLRFFWKRRSFLGRAWGPAFPHFPAWSWPEGSSFAGGLRHHWPISDALIGCPSIRILPQPSASCWHVEPSSQFQDHRHHGPLRVGTTASRDPKVPVAEGKSNIKPSKSSQQWANAIAIAIATTQP